MQGRQKQVIGSYQRVKTFLVVHPAPSPASSRKRPHGRSRPHSRGGPSFLRSTD